MDDNAFGGCFYWVSFLSYNKLSISLDSLSIYRIKMYNDMGSHCLTPLDGRKYFVLILFTSITASLVVIHDITSIMNFVGNPKKSSMS